MTSIPLCQFDPVPFEPFHQLPRSRNLCLLPVRINSNSPDRQDLFMDQNVMTPSLLLTNRVNRS